MGGRRKCFFNTLSVFEWDWLAGGTKSLRPLPTDLALLTKVGAEYYSDRLSATILNLQETKYEWQSPQLGDDSSYRKKMDRVSACFNLFNP